MHKLIVGPRSTLLVILIHHIGKPLWRIIAESQISGPVKAALRQLHEGEPGRRGARMVKETGVLPPYSGKHGTTRRGQIFLRYFIMRNKDPSISKPADTGKPLSPCLNIAANLAWLVSGRAGATYRRPGVLIRLHLVSQLLVN